MEVDFYWVIGMVTLLTAVRHHSHAKLEVEFAKGVVGVI